jgi:hypothetical protein
LHPFHLCSFFPSSSWFHLCTYSSFSFLIYFPICVCHFSLCVCLFPFPFLPLLFISFLGLWFFRVSYFPLYFSLFTVRQTLQYNPLLDSKCRLSSLTLLFSCLSCLIRIRILRLFVLSSPSIKRDRRTTDKLFMKSFGFLNAFRRRNRVSEM